MTDKDRMAEFTFLRQTLDLCLPKALKGDKQSLEICQRVFVSQRKLLGLSPELE